MYMVGLHGFPYPARPWPCGASSFEQALLSLGAGVQLPPFDATLSSFLLLGVRRVTSSAAVDQWRNEGFYCSRQDIGNLIVHFIATCVLIQCNLAASGAAPWGAISLFSPFGAEVRWFSLGKCVIFYIAAGEWLRFQHIFRRKNFYHCQGLPFTWSDIPVLFYVFIKCIYVLFKLWNYFLGVNIVIQGQGSYG